MKNNPLKTIDRTIKVRSVFSKFFKVPYATKISR
ncbi:unknown [[Mannheimia] succiniciproducens MBEL55E]|uniref:Uncharacterized protein n=1 Tax=Mannheimia succiniciproducens (strain KCTC 0769BP / MBEL55E) TaxID=221988 RepID=Q65V67_MANSM|nr:unknown [[Mannheimia] succiniciproducens MBEL55E]